MFSAFKTLTGQTVTVELKNDLAIQRTLKSVDQFLNFKLDDIKVLDEARHPHMVRVSSLRENRHSYRLTITDGSQKLLHSRVGGALRTVARPTCRYTASRGCN